MVNSTHCSERGTAQVSGSGQAPIHTYLESTSPDPFWPEDQGPRLGQRSSPGNSLPHDFLAG